MPQLPSVIERELYGESIRTSVTALGENTMSRFFFFDRGKNFTVLFFIIYDRSVIPYEFRIARGCWKRPKILRHVNCTSNDMTTAQLRMYGGDRKRTLRELATSGSASSQLSTPLHLL